MGHYRGQMGEFKTTFLTTVDLFIEDCLIPKYVPLSEEEFLILAQERHKEYKHEPLDSCLRGVKLVHKHKHVDMSLRTGLLGKYRRIKATIHFYKHGF